MWLVVLCSFLAHVVLIIGFALFLRPEAKGPGAIRVSIASISQVQAQASSNVAPRARNARADAANSFPKHQPSPQSSDELALPTGDGLSLEPNRIALSQAPQPSHIIKPSLPERALMNEVEGDVVLQLVVAADGHVKDAQLIQKLGYGIDELALAAIRQSTFTPARNSEGIAVEGRTVHRYRFKFSD